MEEAGFTFIEPFCMKRIGQVEDLIIQMVTDFVQERPEERAKGNNLATLCSAHPDRDHGRGPSLRRNIQPVQFAPGGARPCSEHDYPDRWRRETRNHTRGELLAEIFGFRAVLVLQCHGKFEYERMETRRVRQWNSVNGIAFSVYLFLRGVQAIVVRKDHYGCILYFMSRQLATLHRLTDGQGAGAGINIMDCSEYVSPAALKFFKIRPYPRRVGSHIAHADARNRTHVQAASARDWHNADDHIVLEPEPEGCCRGFDTALC